MITAQVYDTAATPKHMSMRWTGLDSMRLGDVNQASEDKSRGRVRGRATSLRYRVVKEARMYTYERSRRISVPQIPLFGYIVGDPDRLAGVVRSIR